MSQRKPVIAGNWKLHLNVDEAVALGRQVAEAAAGRLDALECVVAPGFLALTQVIDALRGSGVQVAAQNAYDKPSGAFTGEVSIAQLVAAGAQAVVIGHSERRAIFGEDDALLARKTRAALEARLHTLFCVGESLASREAGESQAVVRKQLHAVLSELPAELRAKLTIAYEPVWAIGTGVSATPEDAHTMHSFIRAELLEALRFGESAHATRILYGGSVKAGNAAALMASAEVDGVLVGGASLDAEAFGAIIAAA